MKTEKIQLLVKFDSEIVKNLNRNIHYDFNYIKKNIDLKKFLKLLNTDSRWKHNSDGQRIIESAVKSCANEKNNDPNIKNLNEKDKEYFLIDYCFFPFEQILQNKDGSEYYYKPTKDLLKVSSQFNEKSEKLSSNGNLLPTISENFQLKFCFEFRSQIQNKISPHSHNLIYSKIDKKYYHVIYLENDWIEEVVAIYNQKLTKQKFFLKILDFQRSRGIELKNIYIDKNDGTDYYKILIEDVQNL